MAYLLKNYSFLGNPQLDGAYLKLVPGCGYFDVVDTPKNGDTIVDCDGGSLAPSFCDLHVHFREPGSDDSETVLSGARAAAKGGYTDVCTMPNTKPPVDSPDRVKTQRRLAAEAPIRVHTLGATTFGQAGWNGTDWREMQGAGVVAFSDDGSPTSNAETMRKALIASRNLGTPIVQHCEDCCISDGGIFNDTIKGLSEDLIVSRDIELARITGGHLHIAHISTGISVGIVRNAKAMGLNVTAEVTPHHLTLSQDDIEIGKLPKSYYKMKPPLRTPQDVDACVQGLIDGTINCIATDHAPHHASKKENEEIGMAAFGVVGLETAFPVLYTRLVKTGRISLAKLILCMSGNPRMMWNLPMAGGGLVVLDLDKTQVITPEFFAGKSHNSPFIGERLTGFPAYTFYKGEMVYGPDA